MQRPGVQTGPQGPGGQPTVTFPLMFGFSPFTTGRHNTTTSRLCDKKYMDAESHEINDQDQLAMPVENDMQEESENRKFLMFALLHVLIEQICAYHSPKKSNKNE
eukprot:scaffold222234_cov18-Prasinocladus_malaysianus.AAC.1